MYFDPGGLATSNDTELAIFASMPPHAASAGEAWLLVASNLTVLAAGTHALIRGRIYAGLWMLIAFAVSVGYHLCLGDLYCAAGVPLQRWRFADHVTATNMIHVPVLMALGLDVANHPLGVVARALMPAIAALTVLTWPFDMQALMLNIVADMVLVLVAIVIVRRGRPLRSERFGAAAIVVALVVMLVAGAAYFADGVMGASGYWLWHSNWHMLIGVAVLLYTRGVSVRTKLQWQTHTGGEPRARRRPR